VIFGIFQHCFVLNTSVTSISNKFIIQVSPPGDKVNNQDFYLQNLARPLRFNFQCPYRWNTWTYLHNFGTIQRRDIVNIPVTSSQTQKRKQLETKSPRSWSILTCAQHNFLHNWQFKASTAHKYIHTSNQHFKQTRLLLLFDVFEGIKMYLYKHLYLVPCTCTRICTCTPDSCTSTWWQSTCHNTAAFTRSSICASRFYF